MAQRTASSSPAPSSPSPSSPAPLSAAERGKAEVLAPAAFVKPLRKRMILYGGWALGAAYLVYLAILFEITPARLWNSLEGLGVILGQMIPPNPGARPWDIAQGLAESLAMAIVGTTLAVIFAVPLGFLAARNVIPSWVLSLSLRRLFDTGRGIDTIIWALVFVTALGLGPIVGVMAIFIAELPVLAKLYADVIESADKRPVEAMRAVGAPKLAEVRYGLLPQCLPVMLSQALYFFESAVRSSTVLGLVGAGGIGMQLIERIRILRWDEVAFIILCVLILVTLVDMASRRLRVRLIQGAPLKASSPAAGQRDDMARDEVRL